MNLIRLGDRRNAVQHAKSCRSHPCVSYTVVDLGARTKYMYFPSCVLTTVFWKNIKINKINFGTGSTDWSHIAKG